MPRCGSGSTIPTEMTEAGSCPSNARNKASVNSVEDFGRFVNNTKCLEPSTFGGKAAPPVLLAGLLRLKNPRVVEAVGRNL